MAIVPLDCFVVPVLRGWDKTHSDNCATTHESDFPIRVSLVSLPLGHVLVATTVGHEARIILGSLACG